MLVGFIFFLPYQSISQSIQIGKICIQGSLHYNQSILCQKRSLGKQRQCLFLQPFIIGRIEKWLAAGFPVQGLAEGKRLLTVRS